MKLSRVHHQYEAETLRAEEISKDLSTIMSQANTAIDDSRTEEAGWPVAIARKHELQCIEDLRQYKILHTQHNPIFDTITELARELLDVSAIFICFVDTEKQWWISSPSLSRFVGHNETRQMPRRSGFCQHVVVGPDACSNKTDKFGQPLDEQPFIVLDSQNDIRIGMNPGYSEFGINFFAGVPLYSERGMLIGSFCAIDNEPRLYFPPENVRILRRFATMAMREVFLLHQKRIVQSKRKSSKLFSEIVAHETWQPLDAIARLNTMLDQPQGENISMSTKDMVKTIKDVSAYLLGVIKICIKIQKDDDSIEHDFDWFRVEDCAQLALTIQSLTNHRSTARLSYRGESDKMLYGDSHRISQILLSLLKNACEFTAADGSVALQSHYNTDSSKLCIECIDTGCGIAAEKVEYIFKPKKTESGGLLPSSPNKLSLGLFIAQRLTKQLGGSLTCQSERGKGSTFRLEVVCPTHHT